MTRQDWVVSVRYSHGDDRGVLRYAVVGPARASTVEAALHLTRMPEATRAEIRSNAIVRKFVNGQLDHEAAGYYAPAPNWAVCIGPIQAVLS